MKDLKCLKVKGMFFLLAMLLFQPFSLKAQTIDTKALSQYKGYENSIETGFLSQFTLNKPIKSNPISKTAFAQSNINYDYHGITGNSTNIPRAQCVDTQGNIYITGSSGNIENNSGDITTIKINEAGEIVWTVRLPSPEFTVNSGTQIMIGNDGFIYLVGYIWNQTSTDIISVKISNDGQIVWQTIIGNSDNFDVPTALTVNSLGEMHIAAITHLDGKVTYYISKISSSGQLIWENTDNNFPAQTWNEPRIIKLDGNGDIVVCGTGFDQDLKSKTLTVKLNASGALVWKKTKSFQAPINNELVITDGWPTDFTLDADDNIYVTNNFALEFIYTSMTLKYDADGIESWNQTHQVGEKNTRIKQILFNQNLLLVGGYTYGDSEDGFTASALNLDGSLNWSQNSSDQLSPQKFSMSVNNNKIHLNSVSFDPITFGGIINSASYAVNSGELTNSATLNLNSVELGFTINDFFDVITSNDSKSIVMSTFYSQSGSIYEVLKINNSDNSTIWNAKFILENSSKTNVLESVSDSESNVVSLVSNFYVADSNANSLSQKSYLAKHDADGNFIATHLIDDSLGLTSVRLAIDNNDNAVVFIRESQATGIKLKKFSNTMQLIWSVTLPLNSLQNELISIDNQNNIYVVAVIESQITAQVINIHVSKFNANGDLLFSNEYQSENELLTNNYVSKILFDGNDNLIIGGTSSSGQNAPYVPTLISISPTGSLNYFKDFPIENFTSSVIDLKRINNDFFLAVSSKNQSNFNGIHMIKSDGQGQLVWQQDYFTEDHNIFLYKLLNSGNNNALYTVSFKGGIFGGNVEVVSWDLNGNTTGFHTLENNNFYQDAFSDSQYLYVLSKSEDEINFPRRLLNWSGPFISSKITKLNFDLTLADSFDFAGNNYSMFEPKQLIPLNNANLLVSGRMFHEELFFEGLKFFSIPYQPSLSVAAFPESKESLFYCSPNPTLNHETDLKFSLKTTEQVKINLYDLNGRYLKQIVNKEFNQGVNSVKFDSKSLSKGIYLLELHKSSGKLSTKLIVADH